MLSTASRRSTFGKALFIFKAPFLQNAISRPLISSRPYRSSQHTLGRRGFLTSPQWRRYAAAEAEVEENFDEGQIESQVNSKKSPSASQIDELRSRGLITKFRELAEQKLVSPVVVETLTKNMGLETMTPVQSLTINETLKGTDV